METQIRHAEESDVEAIWRIYNYYIERSTCTFQIEPETLDTRMKWFQTHGVRHPVTVCCAADKVLGWASLSHFNPRCGYSHTVELSVYIDHRFHRRGIGRSLLVDLIERASELGYHVLIGGVCTEQTASLKLHESMGFVEVARFKEVGRKYDRWLDVAYLQLNLPKNTNGRTRR